MRFWKELWNDESGAVATEYVILVGVIAVALIATLVIFRTKIVEIINSWTPELDKTEP